MGSAGTGLIVEASRGRSRSEESGGRQRERGNLGRDNPWGLTGACTQVEGRKGGANGTGTG